VDSRLDVDAALFSAAVTIFFATDPSRTARDLLFNQDALDAASKAAVEAFGATRSVIREARFQNRALFQQKSEG